MSRTATVAMCASMRRRCRCSRAIQKCREFWRQLDRVQTVGANTEIQMEDQRFVTPSSTVCGAAIGLHDHAECKGALPTGYDYSPPTGPRRRLGGGQTTAGRVELSFTLTRAVSTVATTGAAFAEPIGSSPA